MWSFPHLNRVDQIIFLLSKDLTLWLQIEATAALLHKFHYSEVEMVSLFSTLGRDTLVAGPLGVSYFIYLTFLRWNLKGKNLDFMLMRWRSDVMSPSNDPGCDINITLFFQMFLIITNFDQHSVVLWR